MPDLTTLLNEAIQQAEAGEACQARAARDPVMGKYDLEDARFHFGRMYHLVCEMRAMRPDLPKTLPEIETYLAAPAAIAAE